MKEICFENGYKENKMNARQGFIDVLKGCAILGVIIVHFNTAFSSSIDIVRKIANVGARCPQLFFVISGYLTWMELEKQRENMGRFYKKKFIRIVPLYYLVLFIALFFPTVEFFEHSAGDLISHIFFLNVFIPKWHNCINVEWYISNLIIWYIMAPWLYRFINNFYRSINVFGSLIVLEIIFIKVTNTLLSNKMLEPLYETYFHTQCIVIQFPVLLIGVIAYYILKDKNRKKLLVISILVSVIFTCVFIMWDLNKRLISSTLIAGMLFGCMFIVLAICCREIKSPLILLGKYSLGIYLCHMIVIRCVEQRFKQITDFSVWISLLFVVITTSVVLGSVVEKFINKVCLQTRL